MRIRATWITASADGTPQFAARIAEERDATTPS
jgi:hypothetical protein